MKAEPTTKALIEMLYERIPELFVRPSRTWVGLTYEEESELIRLAHNHAGIRFYIQAAEAKLKEKNT